MGIIDDCKAIVEQDEYGYFGLVCFLEAEGRFKDATASGDLKTAHESFMEMAAIQNAYAQGGFRF